MATLADVKKTWEGVRLTTAVFGASPEFLQEFGNRLSEIGRAMMEELHLAPFRDFGTLLSLPLTTELPPIAAAKFEELKAWLQSQHESFGEL